MTLLNYWHFTFFGITGVILVSGLLSAFKQKNPRLILPMIISTILVSALFGVFSVIIVDKYTKIPKL